MPKFNHAFTLAFSLVSGDENGEDVTPQMLRTALLKRIVDLDESRPDQGEWIEAVGPPYDTHEEYDVK